MYAPLKNQRLRRSHPLYPKLETSILYSPRIRLMTCNNYCGTCITHVRLNGHSLLTLLHY